MQTTIPSNTNPVTIHANFVVIDGIGVLIRGPNLVGKSEISLMLIEKGYKLISDDAVEIFKNKSHLIGKCPQQLRGFLQINYLGILNITKIFDNNAIGNQHKIDISINITKERPVKLLNPLKPIRQNFKILATSITEFLIPLDSHRNLALFITMLVKNYKLEQNNYHSYQDFILRNN